MMSCSEPIRAGPLGTIPSPEVRCCTTCRHRPQKYPDKVVPIYWSQNIQFSRYFNACAAILPRTAPSTCACGVLGGEVCPWGV